MNVYLRKQITVQAVQYKGDNIHEILNAFPGEKIVLNKESIYFAYRRLIISKGDFIIKFPEGFFARMSEENFNSVYEAEVGVAVHPDIYKKISFDASELKAIDSIICSYCDEYSLNEEQLKVSNKIDSFLYHENDGGSNNEKIA